MLIAPTLLVVSHVLAVQDILEMDSTAQVNKDLVTCIVNKQKQVLLHEVAMRQNDNFPEITCFMIHF